MTAQAWPVEDAEGTSPSAGSVVNPLFSRAARPALGRHRGRGRPSMAQASSRTVTPLGGARSSRRRSLAVIDQSSSAWSSCRPRGRPGPDDLTSYRVRRLFLLETGRHRMRRGRAAGRAPYQEVAASRGLLCVGKNAPETRARTGYSGYARPSQDPGAACPRECKSAARGLTVPGNVGVPEIPRRAHRPAQRAFVMPNHSGKARHPKTNDVVCRDRCRMRLPW